MSDLDKLKSQLGLKDIDISRITQVLNEYQDPLIKLALVIGTLLMVGVMFNEQRINSQELRVRTSRVQERLEVVKKRDAAIQELNNFKSSMPKELTVFDVIPLISDYAKLYNNTITSYNPDQTKDMGLYNLLNVSFNIQSDNFKDMMLFLRKIEKSNYFIRINSWSGHEEANGQINYAIQISAVFIHP